MNQFDLTFLDKYRAIRAQNRKPKTIYNEIVILSQLTRFAVSRKMLLQNPLAGLKLKKPKPTPQPCFDDEQVEKILRLALPGDVNEPAARAADEVA